MATIGTFTASENGYNGLIKTLTLNIKAKFVASEKEHEKAPDYRILAGSTEFGAAWKKTGRDRSANISRSSSELSGTALRIAGEGRRGRQLYLDLVASHRRLI